MISNGPVHFRMHVYSPSTSKIIQEQARLPVLGQHLSDQKVSKLLPCHLNLLLHFTRTKGPHPHPQPLRNVAAMMHLTRPDHKSINTKQYSTEIKIPLTCLKKKRTINVTLSLYSTLFCLAFQTMHCLDSAGLPVEIC